MTLEGLLGGGGRGVGIEDLTLAGLNLTLLQLLLVIPEGEPVVTVDHLARAGGYEVVHRSPTMADALRFLKSQWSQQRQSFGVDVVLLDMNLPDGHGLEVLRQMRSAGFTGGVLALTGATELKTIRQAIALGVVQYLVKPFGYQQFAERLRAFREVSSEFAGTGSALDQDAVDRAFR